jgi:CBS domain-containing protein
VPVPDNGRLVGIVTIGDVLKVLFDRRDFTTVAEIMAAAQDFRRSMVVHTPAIEAIDVLAGART